MLNVAALVLAIAFAVPQSDSTVLIDFSRSTADDWIVVNDDVMGGVSASRIDVGLDGIGVFTGRLSLENNGGFASIRTDMRAFDLSDASALVLRVRGDGRRYEVRLRTDGRFDGIAYQAAFDTDAGRWITVTCLSQHSRSRSAATCRPMPLPRPGGDPTIWIPSGGQERGSVSAGDRTSCCHPRFDGADGNGSTAPENPDGEAVRRWCDAADHNHPASIRKRCYRRCRLGGWDCRLGDVSDAR